MTEPDWPAMDVSDDAIIEHSSALGLDAATILVKRYHKLVGTPYSDAITLDVANSEWRRLDAQIHEELEEFEEAVKSKNLEKVAHEFADLLYAVLGAAAMYGLPAGRLFLVVHTANMTKSPRGRSGKKARKGEDYVVPAIQAALDAPPLVDELADRPRPPEAG